MSNQTITNVANIALAISVIIALIFGIAQVKAAAQDRRERLTLEILRQFQTREFAELLYFINAHKFPVTREELRKMPADDQIRMIQFAQQMESLGMIVAERLINIGLVDKTIGSFVTDSWLKYKVLFLRMRDEIPDPFLGEYFQWLAETMEKRLSENPRTPVHQLITKKGRK